MAQSNASGGNGALVQDITQSNVNGGAGGLSVRGLVFNMSNPLNVLYKQEPSKPQTASKINPQVTREEVGEMGSIALGIVSFNDTCTQIQNCWACAITCKKNPGLYDPIKGIKKSAGLNASDPLNGFIASVTKSNKANGGDDTEHSPLAKRDKEALYLHLCIWLHPKFCTHCKGDVFALLFDDFDFIFNFIVDKFRTTGDADYQNTFFKLQKYKFEKNVYTRSTGVQTLFGRQINKLASAEFVAKCIYEVYGEINGDVPKYIEMMKTPLTEEEILAKKTKVANDLEKKRENRFEKSKTNISQQVLALELQIDSIGKREKEMLELNKSLASKTLQLSERKSHFVENIRESKSRKMAKRAKTSIPAAASDAQGGGGSEPEAGGTGESVARYQASLIARLKSAAANPHDTP